MPLDHFISQVHLRKFCAPDLPGMMRAIRKPDLKRFPCKPKDVCRIAEGSTNPYLAEGRAIEEFLFNVEPKYNSAIATLREGKPDREDVLAIAGFAAYVGTCSPAAMRIHSEPLRNQVRTTAELLDRDGVFGRAPPSLGGKTITQLFADGDVIANIDPKFPQAIGIANVIGLSSLFGNAAWELLVSDDDHSPFFTSDYPLALEAVAGKLTPNWIVPLAPSVALRIVPDAEMRGRPTDLTFSSFRLRRREVGHQEIRALNTLIVRCAESFVFYGAEQHWIESFVAKHRYYRTEGVTDRIPVGTGITSVFRQKIVERRPA